MPVNPSALVVLLGFVGVPALLGGYLVAAERLLRGLPAKRQRTLRPWLWLAPALLFLTVFLAYPVAYTFGLSVLGPESCRFVGLDNYRFVLTGWWGSPAPRSRAGWCSPS